VPAIDEEQVDRRRSKHLQPRIGPPDDKVHPVKRHAVTFSPFAQRVRFGQLEEDAGVIASKHGEHKRRKTETCLERYAVSVQVVSNELVARVISGPRVARGIAVNSRPAISQNASHVARSFT
jgi:hypothetical protein